MGMFSAYLYEYDTKLKFHLLSTSCYINRRSFYMGHPQNGYNPALMAMQATLLQAQTAAAMAASGSGAATPSGAHRAKDSSNADRTNFNHLKDAMSMGGVSLRVGDKSSVSLGNPSADFCCPFVILRGLVERVGRGGLPQSAWSNT
jgi:hypothetical protein